MGGLLDILKGPIGEIIGGVRGVINDLHTSGEEKLQAQLKLSELDVAFRQKVLEAEARWAEAQADVIKSEAQGESWLQRNWRPILMLTFTYIIAHNYVISPIFSVPSVPIPEHLWELLKIGIGGYIISRSGEKVAKVLKK